MYEAISIKDAIDVLLAEKNKEYVQSKNAAKALLGKLQKLKLSNPPPEDQFSMMSGEKAYLKLFFHLCQSTKHSIDMIIPSRLLAKTRDILLPKIEQSLQKGITTRLIKDLKINDTNHNSSGSLVANKLFTNPKWQQRFNVNLPISFTIFDKKKCLFSTEKQVYSKSPFIFTNNSCLIAVMQSYFENTWSLSNQFQLEPKTTQKKHERLAPPEIMNIHIN